MQLKEFLISVLENANILNLPSVTNVENKLSTILSIRISISESFMSPLLIAKNMIFFQIQTNWKHKNMS